MVDRWVGSARMTHGRLCSLLLYQHSYARRSAPVWWHTTSKLENRTQQREQGTAPRDTGNATRTFSLNSFCWFVFRSVTWISLRQKKIQWKLRNRIKALEKAVKGKIFSVLNTEVCIRCVDSNKIFNNDVKINWFRHNHRLPFQITSSGQGCQPIICCVLQNPPRESSPVETSPSPVWVCFLVSLSRFPSRSHLQMSWLKRKWQEWRGERQRWRNRVKHSVTTTEG